MAIEDLAGLIDQTHERKAVRDALRRKVLPSAPDDEVIRSTPDAGFLDDDHVLEISRLIDGRRITFRCEAEPPTRSMWVICSTSGKRLPRELEGRFTGRLAVRRVVESYLNGLQTTKGD